MSIMWNNRQNLVKYFFNLKANLRKVSKLVQQFIANKTKNENFEHFIL